jgi:hypothetical protein
MFYSVLYIFTCGILGIETAELVTDSLLNRLLPINKMEGMLHSVDIAKAWEIKETIANLEEELKQTRMTKNASTSGVI